MYEEQEEIIPKSQLIESADSISNDLRSKLVFVRRISSDKNARQKCHDESPRRRDNQNPKYAGKLKKKTT